MSPAAKELVAELKAALEEDEGLQDQLDDLVYEAKSDEASDLNNNGVERQVRYLLQGCESEAEAIEEIRGQLLCEEDDV